MATSRSSGGNAGALQLLHAFGNLVDQCSSAGRSLARKLNDDVVCFDDAEANRNSMGGALLVTKAGGNLSAIFRQPISTLSATLRQPCNNLYQKIMIIITL